MEHHYLAQLCYRLYLLQHTVTHMFDQRAPKPRYRPEDFLIESEGDEPVILEDEPEETDEERRKRMERSRRFWLRRVGLGRDGKVQTKLPPKRKPKSTGGSDVRPEAGPSPPG